MSLASSFYSLLWRQSWLPLRSKKSIYKRLCELGETPDAPFTTDFFGLTYQGNLNNSIEMHLYYNGAFEKPLLFFLRDCIQALKARSSAPAIFFDVGANIGQHSLFMSRYADQVHAFEPYAPVRDRLAFHVGLNKLANIQLHAFGLSHQAEELPFYAPTGRNQGIGSFDASSVSKGNKEIGRLHLVNGDDCIKLQGLGPVSMMKIDVEGFEKNVLAGLRLTLIRDRPVLVTEITYGNPLSFESVKELLEALPPDYCLFAFDTRKADGSKARRRGAKAKRSGDYTLVSFDRWLETGQDDVIACPREKLVLLPRGNPAPETQKA